LKPESADAGLFSTTSVEPPELEIAGSGKLQVRCAGSWLEAFFCSFPRPIIEADHAVERQIVESRRLVACPTQHDSFLDRGRHT
jgi:hypothetical protein